MSSILKLLPKIGQIQTALILLAALLVVSAISCVSRDSALDSFPAVVKKFDGFTAMYPTWAPNGKEIAFVDITGLESELGYLSVLDIATGSVRRLTDQEESYAWPKWSPDSTFLAVNRGWQIWLVRATDGTTEYLTEGVGVAWSPDGQTLAVFQSPRPKDPGAFQIIFVDRSGKELNQISLNPIPPHPTPTYRPTQPGTTVVEVPLGVFNMQRFSGMDWSPDGHSIIYSAAVPNTTPSNTLPRSKLYLLDIATGKFQLLTTDGENEYPVWSPDGDKLAYLSGDPVPSDLIIATLRGDRLVQLKCGFYFGMSSWSPDGRQLLVKARGIIYILDVQTLLNNKALATGKCE
jgi:Tol biopolymer transport system component